MIFRTIATVGRYSFPFVAFLSRNPTTCIKKGWTGSISSFQSSFSLVSTKLSVMPTRPEPPLSYSRLCDDKDNDQNEKFLRVSTFSAPCIAESLKLKEDNLEQIYKHAKSIEIQLRKCRKSVNIYGIDHDDTKNQLKEVNNEFKITFDSIRKMGKSDESKGSSVNAPREGNLGHKLEDAVRLYAYCHFLSTGTLITLKECNEVMADISKNFQISDDEYLAGVIGVAQDLSKYGIGRATVRDDKSTDIARELVSQLFEVLLKFDFRNGPLRRKFDGTKYALKRLENILYELSVTSLEEEFASFGSDNEHKSKRVRMEICRRVDQEEMEQIRLRMEARDELRETVIKRTRDSQKAAKQAIYALHRGDQKRANKLISECETIAKELLPIIEKEPQLRYGSYRNSLEEYAEAMLFRTWLNEEKIASPGDLPLCDETEYLGGLCDLTGEVGRVAVVKGTARDIPAVQFALATNSAIKDVLETLPLSKNILKKIGPLETSVGKLEQMLYELSLTRGGRTNPPSGGMSNDEPKTTLESN